MPIVTTRPRLLVTAADIPGLKARAATNDPDWLAVLNDANAAMADPNRYGGTALIYNLDLAYLITGNALYADRATGLVMKQVAGGPASWARDSGYDSRDRLPALCVHLDWAYDRLTLDQRTAILNYCEGWVDWVWQGVTVAPGTHILSQRLQEDYDYGRLSPEQLTAINAAREVLPEHWEMLVAGARPPYVPGGAYSVKEPAGNYFLGFVIGTLFTALTGSGESVRTGYFLNLFEQKLAMHLAYQQGAAAGGWYHEGSSYGMAGMVQNLCLTYAAYKTATGESRFDKWCDDAMTCKVAMTTLDMKGVVSFGDQASDTHALFSDITRLGALLYAKFNPDSPVNVRGWLAAITPNTKLYYYYRWADFVYAPPVAPAFSPPPVFFAPGAGFAVRRFGDTQHFWRLGTNQADHNDLATGEIASCRNGDWLIGLARQASHSGIQRTAEFCNCLTVNGYGQSARNLVDQSLLPAVTEVCEDGDGYTYRRGEAGAAYVVPSSSKLIPLLKSWKRHDLCLESGVRIIYDRVEPVDPASVVKLHTNYLAPVLSTVGANQFRRRVGDSWIETTALLPVTPPQQVELRLGPPGSTTVTSWRQDQAQSGSICRFLNVHQIGAVGLIPQLVTGDSVLLRVGATQVGLSGFFPVPTQWITDADEFFYVGLTPGQTLYVSEGNGSAGQQVQVSEGGVLHFKGQVAGSRTVKITADAPPPPGPTLKDAADEFDAIAVNAASIWLKLNNLQNEMEDLEKEVETLEKRANEAEDRFRKASSS